MKVKLVMLFIGDWVIENPPLYAATNYVNINDRCMPINIHIRAVVPNHYANGIYR